jgi:hypothetical protein
MRKGQVTTLEERIEIGERWQAGQGDAEIAKEMVSLPVYQLQLPFSQATWRQLMLCDSLTGTTL